MKLQEDVDILFGSNEFSVIKKVYRNSSKSNINYTSDDDRKIVERVIKQINSNIASNNAKMIYTCLHAASFGPDVKSNPLLRYLISITKTSVFSNSSPHGVDQIEQVLNWIENKEITISKNIDAYLLNTSLYDRNDQDFAYTVKAFDAVIYKRNRYFDGNFVKVSLDNETLKKFFGEDVVPEAGYAQEDEFDFDLEEALLKEEVYVSQVPVDQKYFFSKRQVSNTDTIIPAGMNSSDISEINIWNYMEIWSNNTDTDRTESNSGSATRRRNAEKV